MINKQLLEPQSIVVIGGSNNTHKPGGAVVRNLISGIKESGYLSPDLVRQILSCAGIPLVPRY